MLHVASDAACRCLPFRATVGAARLAHCGDKARRGRRAHWSAALWLHVVSIPATCASRVRCVAGVRCAHVRCMPVAEQRLATDDAYRRLSATRRQGCRACRSIESTRLESLDADASAAASARVRACAVVVSRRPGGAFTRGRWAAGRYRSLFRSLRASARPIACTGTHNTTHAPTRLGCARVMRAHARTHAHAQQCG